MIVGAVSGVVHGVVDGVVLRAVVLFLVLVPAYPVLSGCPMPRGKKTRRGGWSGW